MNLRHFQSQAIKSIREKFAGDQSTLLVLPTGCGKTVVFSHLIKQMVEEEHGRVMILAHRDELLAQASDKIFRITGIMPDMEKADRWADQHWQTWRSPVVVSSVQTQVSGKNGDGRMTRFDPSHFGLVVIDEAHHATSPTYRKILEHYRKNPKIKILGVTATPNRTDEEALGQVFGSCAFEYWIADAIHDGWLVPIAQQVKYLQDLDLSKVKTTAGDLNGAELARVLEYEELILAMADETRRACGSMKTLIFTASVAQAQRYAEILNRYDNDCARFISGKTPFDERRQMLRDYADKRFQYLVNCSVFTEGFDDPGIEAVVMAKPTKSQPLYTQMIGRGTRPLPGTVDGIDDYEPQQQLGIDGHTEQADIRRKRIAESAKPRVLVLDFVGNAGRHKLITACDVLGGKYSDVVLEAAKRDAEKGGIPKDVADRLREAQERLAREAAEAHKRKHIVGTAFYTSRDVDPFDALGITAEREPGWAKGRKPSEKMVAILEKRGIDTKNLTMGQASQLIGEIFKRDQEASCSVKQGRVLLRAGFDGNMKMKLAKPILDVLFANNFRWPAGVPRPRPDGTMPDGVELNAVEFSRRT